MSIFPRDIIESGMKDLRDLLPDRNGELRLCTLTYPKNMRNTRLRSKTFKIPCIVHSINERSMDDGSVYQSGSLMFYLLYSDLDESGSGMSNFKTDNVILNYKGKLYEIKEEVETAMATGIRLYCTKKS